MSRRRRMTGRVKIDFSKIEAIAAEELADGALARATADNEWRLTKHSAFYRCRDGSYTLCLIWHGKDGTTLTSTMRGIVVEAG